MEEPGIVASWAGFCPICLQQTRFTARDPWFREHLLCETCAGGSIPRERALMLVIRELLPNWAELDIHESSPAPRGVSPLLRTCAAGYVPTHFWPGVQLGTLHDGIRCENLEAQTFPPESFDLVITQDVMEHVFDPERAYAEIYRTLRPGGHHIHTTPIYKSLEHTRQMARLGDDGEITYLAEPEYHGNPISGEGSLVTFRYGYDLADRIAQWAPFDVEIRRFADRTHGIVAEFTEVVVCAKPRPLRELAGRDRLLDAAPLLGEDAWIELQHRSVDAPVIDGMRMPLFPPAALQEVFVGASGRAALDEAAAFYRAVKAGAATAGVPLRRDSAVLDFGCGWGRITRFFLRDVDAAGLVGCDVLPGMVDMCRRLDLRARFVVTPPAPPSDLATGSFDVIYAYSVLTHMSEELHLACIAEFRRLLRPGGVLVASVLSRRFIGMCEELRRGPAQESAMYQALVRSFADTAQTYADFDADRFSFAGTGGGTELPPECFGLAVFSEGYVRRAWAPHLEVIGFSDDPAVLQQAVVVARRPPD